MGCIWRGSNRTDTTGIRSVLWEWSQALISPGCPWGGNRETFLALHPALPHLPYLSITFKGCGLGRGPGLGRAGVGSRRWSWNIPGFLHLLLLCSWVCLPFPHPSPSSNTHLCSPQQSWEKLNKKHSKPTLTHCRAPCVGHCNNIYKKIIKMCQV